MLGALYKTKKDLKASVGKTLRCVETKSRPEYVPTGRVEVMGPCVFTDRRWAAVVVLKNNIIQAVR